MKLRKHNNEKEKKVSTTGRESINKHFIRKDPDSLLRKKMVTLLVLIFYGIYYWQGMPVVVAAKSSFFLPIMTNENHVKNVHVTVWFVLMKPFVSS
jgi:hypothetical protein